MKERVKVGYVGVGRRGLNMLKLALSKMGDVDIVTICDLDEKKLAEAKEVMENAGRYNTVYTTAYEDVLNNDSIEAVFLFTCWDKRLHLARQAMMAGKYTAVEVGCAESLDECFALVDTYEKTGVPLMMLENICYSKFELMALNMIKKGLFGEIVHCAGGYCHYLNNDELFREMTHEPKGDKVTHYRLGHYMRRNLENYPTHELGPIAKCLGINRGNRFVSLSSFASKSCGLKDYAATNFGKDNYYANIDYKQGDIVNTVITCAGGETILLTLDTTLPRPFYSRQFTVRGTKGMCYEDGNVFFLEGMEEPTRNNVDEMFAKYGHPLSLEVQKCEDDRAKIEQDFGLHPGGVDWMIFRAFIDSVKAGTQTPIDVYDAAAWLSIGPLSEMSIASGGKPVEVPDFTKGKWQNREPIVRSKYCLDEVIVDDSIGIYDSLDVKA